MADEHLNEQWRPVVGYEGWYEVSDCGRVKRVKAGPGTRVGRILVPDRDRRGYLLVHLCHGPGVPHLTIKVHRMVMAAFVGPCPPSLQVNHKNGIKADNRTRNLEYVTPKENMRHAVDVLGISMVPNGENNGSAKLTANAVRDIRLRYSLGGLTKAQLAREYAVGQTAVGQAISRKTWKHVP